MDVARNDVLKSRAMFSRRTSWPRQENLLASKARLARRDPEFIDFTTSNVTSLGLSTCPSFPSALASTGSSVYAPLPLGMMDTREAVSAYYARRGLNVPAERIVLTSTTSEAYAFVFRLLADSGEEIRAPVPSYPLFSFLGELSDVSIVPYPLHFNGDRWAIDLDALDREISDTVRAILLVCPNNPTGSLPSLEERTKLLEMARRRKIALISDEVFLDYLTEGREPHDASFINEDAPLILTLSGLSKVAGLPQAKLSWIVLSGGQAEVDEATARLEIIADTFLSVSTPIQVAAPTLLAEADLFQSGLRTRLCANWTTLLEVTSSTSRLFTRPIEGGWNVIVEIRSAPWRPDPSQAEPWRPDPSRPDPSRPDRGLVPRRPEALDDEALAIALLDEERLLVQPGFLFDIEDVPVFILSLLPPEASFREGCRRLARFAARPR